MNCGYIIENLCKKNNITKKEFSVKTGINETNFTYWKKGRTPNGDILAKIADFFNVSTDYLLGRENTSMEQNSLNGEEFKITNLDSIELELIYEFRRADEDKQKKIIDMVKILNK